MERSSIMQELEKSLEVEKIKDMLFSAYDMIYKMEEADEQVSNSQHRAISSLIHMIQKKCIEKQLGDHFEHDYLHKTNGTMLAVSSLFDLFDKKVRTKSETFKGTLEQVALFDACRREFIDQLDKRCEENKKDIAQQNTKFEQQNSLPKM